MKRKIDRVYELNRAEVIKALQWYLARVKDWPVPDEEHRLHFEMGDKGDVRLSFTEEIEETDE
jgi:hypothetical protein